MRIAIIASNYLPLGPETTKGTEIFVYAFAREMEKRMAAGGGRLTVFCAGDSTLPVNIESVTARAVSSEASLPAGKHVIFELALIEKAFRMEKDFDLFHVHIGNGDIALPFVPFIKKPVLVTLHYTIEPYAREFFLRYKDIPHLHLVGISDSQRRAIPELPYCATIYHGIDEQMFSFDAEGGESLMWAGRGAPEKGIEDAVEVARRASHQMRLFVMRRPEHAAWFERCIQRLGAVHEGIIIHYDTPRERLIGEYQKSKAFIFPIQWEEPFGLVMIEAMSCGTPMIAYARGSAPEIIEDGKTGFLVNPSDADKRGEWIIKESGVEGLMKAVERIYAMDRDDYRAMRQRCRTRVVDRFTIRAMMDAYERVYGRIENEKVL